MCHVIVDAIKKSTMGHDGYVHFAARVCVVRVRSTTTMWHEIWVNRRKLIRFNWCGDQYVGIIHTWIPMPLNRVIREHWTYLCLIARNLRVKCTRPTAHTKSMFNCLSSIFAISLATFDPNNRPRTIKIPFACEFQKCHRTSIKHIFKCETMFLKNRVKISSSRVAALVGRESLAHGDRQKARLYVLRHKPVIYLLPGLSVADPQTVDRASCRCPWPIDRDGFLETVSLLRSTVFTGHLWNALNHFVFRRIGKMSVCPVDKTRKW